MANETVNQDNNATNDNNGADRTFTQAELDNIVKERIAREREKYKDFDALKEKAAKLDEIEAANKSELDKANEKAEKLQKELDSIKKAETIRTVRDKVAKETGVPAELLNGDTEEACSEQAKAILEFKSSNGYPTVKDGGETHHTSGGTNGDKFADWFESNGF